MPCTRSLTVGPGSARSPIRTPSTCSSGQVSPRGARGQARDVRPALSAAEPGRVFVSDAFELLRTLADESVDLLVTDPPYESLQLHRSRGTTTRLTTNWFATVPNERLPELFREVYRVLRPDRHFYLFCDEVTSDVIKQQQGIGADRLPNGARRARCGLVYWKEIVWAKTTGEQCGQKSPAPQHRP